MSKLDANRSPERRLDELIKQITAPEIKENINQPAKETSRWIKWGFNTAESTIPGYQIVKKSESNIFNRLLDRIDSVAGQARQEANKEITRMLKDSCFRPHKTGPSALVIHRLFFSKQPWG